MLTIPAHLRKKKNDRRRIVRILFSDFLGDLCSTGGKDLRKTQGFGTPDKIKIRIGTEGNEGKRGVKVGLFAKGYF